MQVSHSATWGISIRNDCVVPHAVRPVYRTIAPCQTKGSALGTKVLEPESLNRTSSERLPGTGDAVTTVTMRTGSKFAPSKRSKVLAPRISESNVLQQGD